MTEPKYVNWDIKQPGISFCLSEGRITLFKTTMEILGYPEYYRFLFSPESRVFAVQACKIGDEGANRGKMTPGLDHLSLKSLDLVRFVYRTCDWKEKPTYRVPGIGFPEDKAVQFNLREAYEIHESRVMMPEPVNAP